jgi:probable HAF family extracellular repeat protein
VLTNTLPNGGSSAFASAVNNNGQVVGPATLAGDTVTHAFLWQEGVGMKDLGSLLPGDTFVFPQSINNRGEVVGLSCGSEPTATGCAGFSITPFSAIPAIWRLLLDAWARELRPPGRGGSAIIFLVSSRHKNPRQTWLSGAHDGSGQNQPQKFSAFGSVAAMSEAPTSQPISFLLGV